jgi:lipopolysaccharide/colanic/teichoic acid biosynthesis glycosyltransferase
MLVRMPRGPVDENRVSVREECDPFEAALRRDLASTPVVSYESTIGGWTKRGFDIVLTTLTAPVWLVLLLVAGLVAKLRHRERVYHADERIGYGGRPYRCFHLRLDPPAAELLILHPPQGEAAANELAAISLRAEDRRAKWRHALERLPQMFNVIRGDMSLVGPAPLTRADLEPLKTAKRYYLSARPGVVGINGLVGESDEHAAQYKVYSLCWSLVTDANLLMTASVSLNKRGELWKPRPGERQLVQGDEAAARRRTRAEDRIGV